MYQPEFIHWVSRYWKSVIGPCIILLFTAFLISIWKKVYVNPQEDWISGLVHLLILIYSTGIIIVIVGFAEARNLSSKILIKLGGMTLGIYLTHNLFITYSTKIIYHLFPALLYYQFLVILILFLVGLSGSLLLMTIVRKTSLKRFYPYLFG